MVVAASSPILEAPDSITIILGEIEAGHGLSLSKAARILGGVDPSTVFRFIMRGAKSESGEPVRLEGIRLGGRWATTRTALERYVRALASPVKQQPATEPKAKPRKQVGAAARKLQALGC